MAVRSTAIPPTPSHEVIELYAPGYYWPAPIGENDNF
jgi:hypothetical protein